MEKSAEYYIDKGRKHYNKSEYPEAMKCYTMALELKPEDDNVYVLRAYCRRRFKDLSGEMEDYSLAIKINSKNIKAYLNRAYCKEKLGDIKGALEDYIKMTEINPNLIDGYLMASNLYLKVKNKKAAHIMDLKAKAITPMSSDDFSARALDKSSDKKYTEAIEGFTTAIEMDLETVCLSLTFRAGCKEKMGKYKEAIKDYLKAIELSPHSYFHNHYYYDIAKCKEKLNDFEGALECYSKSIEYDCIWYLPYKCRGELKIELGRIEEGNADIQKSSLLKK